MLIQKIGIFLLYLIFLLSLFSKTIDFNGLVKTISGTNIPFPTIAALIAIGMLAIGVLSMVAYQFGFTMKQNAKYGIDTLILFTVIATYFFHDFRADPSQIYHVQKNLAIIGGLLYLRSTM